MNDIIEVTFKRIAPVKIHIRYQRYSNEIITPIWLVLCIT